MNDLAYRVTELERRLTNLVRVGKVAAADYQAAQVRVQIGPITTAWRPWLTLRAGGDRTWWAPEVGEQVLLFSPAGEPAQGWVLPAGFSDAAPAPAASPDIKREVFADGSEFSFDRSTGTLTVNVTGDVSVVAGGRASLEAGGPIDVTAAEAITVTAGGPVSIEAPAIAMVGTAAGATLTGDFNLIGSLSVEGDVSATGTIIDAGGNTANHTH